MKDLFSDYDQILNGKLHFLCNDGFTKGESFFLFSAVVFPFEKTIVDFLVSFFLIITHRLIQLNYFW